MYYFASSWKFKSKVVIDNKILEIKVIMEIYIKMEINVNPLLPEFCHTSTFEM